MQNTQINPDQAVGEFYNLTANLLVNEKRTASEARTALMEKGLSENAAYTIVQNVETEIKKAKRERAGKDILFGALWCVGGTIATLADIGFIFWGAILFGAIQLIKGIAGYVND